MKSLYDISDKITEEEYRADGKMHYSTLATFDRGGFNCLSTLFDRKETPSLLLGSIVDTLLTDGQEAFDNQYMVADFPNITSDNANMIKGVFEVYKDTYTSLEDIPDNILASILDSTGNYTIYKKTDSKAKKMREIGSEYYRLLYLADNKTLVSNEVYNDAYKMVQAVRTSPATAYLFAPNNPFEPEIERLYQIKFSGTFDGIDYSCMMDSVYVNHNKKIIVPIDLKTSSHYEYEFYKSFVDWSY